MLGITGLNQNISGKIAISYTIIHICLLTIAVAQRALFYLL